MRRLSVTLLVALLVLPAAALAARADKGDGSFELKAGNGTFIMTGRGVVLAQMDKGILRVTDLNPLDGLQPAVSGAERVRPATDDPNTLVYQGTNIHVRITGGKYKLHFRGSGVDLTAVGVGTADLTGSLLTDPGTWSVDGAKWTAVPLVDRVVPFGTPVTPTTGP